MSRPFEEVDRHVRDVLLELMSASASDSVRVSAAKALMEKIKKNEGENEETQRDNHEHAAVILEAQKLLEEIAAAKSCGADRAREVDQDGPTRPVDAVR